jgi:sugar O-acyltransferase (sialic acid O-acetyltransferase NeuD family)
VDRPSEDLLVWGAGGHGRVVADLIRSLGLRVAGFIDADQRHLNQAAEPDESILLMYEGDFVQRLRGESAFPDGVSGVALGIGNNLRRFQLLTELGELIAPPLVHSRAAVTPSAAIGVGTVVLANAVINSRARVGAGGIINSGAIIEHDCSLGRGVHVSPGSVLSGSVTVGDRAWIGAGAVVVPGITVGSDSVIGAGAVVLRDVADNTTVVGNPARLIHQREV